MVGLVAPRVNLLAEATSGQQPSPPDDVIVEAWGRNGLQASLLRVERQMTEPDATPAPSTTFSRLPGLDYESSEASSSDRPAGGRGRADTTDPSHAMANTGPLLRLHLLSGIWRDPPHRPPEDHELPSGDARPNHPTSRAELRSSASGSGTTARHIRVVSAAAALLVMSACRHEATPRPHGPAKVFANLRVRPALCERMGMLTKDAPTSDDLIGKTLLERSVVIVPVGNDERRQRYELQRISNACDSDPYLKDEYQLRPAPCSGFLLDSTTLLTAWHCVSDGGDRVAIGGFHGAIKSTLEPGTDGVYSFKATSCERVAPDPHQNCVPFQNPECRDTALCRLEDATSNAPRQLTGIPLSRFDPDANSYYVTHMLGMRAMRSKGPITVEPEGKDKLNAYVDCASGSSGSPIVQQRPDASLTIVGVVSQATVDPCPCGTSGCGGCLETDVPGCDRLPFFEGTCAPAIVFNPVD
jgi:Trypsin-like peptidase domain